MRPSTERDNGPMKRTARARMMGLDPTATRAVLRACETLGSELKHARANEIRQTFPLIVVEHSVHLRERLDDGVTQALGARHALVPAFLRTCVAEGSSFDGVGEGCDRTTVIDVGLRVFGLQIVEDAHELCDLRLREIQLVRQEPERPSNAEGAAASSEGAVLGAMSVTASAEPSLAESTSGTAAGVQTTALFTTTLATAGVLVPPIKCRMHVALRLAGAISLPAGFTRGHHASRGLFEDSS